MTGRRSLIGLGIGASVALIAWLIGLTPVIDHFEAVTYDARVRVMARPADPSSPVVVIEIDEASIRDLEPAFGRWPWPRAVHAGVIDFLVRGKAKLIVYDVLFSEHDVSHEVAVGGRLMSGAQSDAEFVAAVRAAGNVILAADATFAGTKGGVVRDEGPLVLPGVTYHPGPGFVQRPDVRRPFAELSDVARALGHTYTVKESDDAVRRMRPFVMRGDVALPSLGLAAALAAQAVPPTAVSVAPSGDELVIGVTRMPLLDEPELSPEGTRVPSKQVLLNFPAPVDGVVFPRKSFEDVLISESKIQDQQEPLIPPSFFANKIVFVGTSAAGLGDLHTMPFQTDAAPGVILHATLADNVLGNRFMQRSSALTDLSIALFAGAAAGALATAMPVIWGTAASLGLAVVVIGFLTRAVGQGAWIGLVSPLLAIALAVFGGVAWQYFVEDREKRRIRQLFSRYVSRDVINQLMENPKLAQLGGVRRDMTVLFSDIRGFTTATEQGTPEAVVTQLNEYFGAMVDVLFRHQGTLDKFVGDMVMGLFSAPLDDPHHADHAVEAALEMSAELDRLNVRWAEEGKPVVNIGIGINSGEMIAGNIGSSAIMSYTVIGDAVNLGSRLESLNKEYGTRILISEATKNQLTIPVETRLIGKAHVKGRAEPVVVYEVKP